ncbi:MAG: insulinase family protein [Candidatus Amulumruptor caecigallinarius]|nr:insulinase family protein [Candidatus Amulumruptor caecigallinarius]
MKTLIHTLSNGLRIIARQSDGNVAYAGVLVNAGSRDDSPDTEGLAHFVEHTIFKGTAKRSSLQISNRLESVGGELNAYTTKEETCIYATSPKGYEARALELMADLVGNASFPEQEVERERSVIVEEINCYIDNPAEYAFDEFESRIYAGSELSHNILGTAQSVKSLTSADAKGFIAQNYTADNMVLYILAPTDPGRLLKMAEKYFAFIRPVVAKSTRQQSPDATAFRESFDLGHHQSNTLVGTRMFAYSDPRRHALYLLNNILGGPNMSSRLNVQLREKRGLVYSVDSYTSLNSDAGMFLVYFGSDPGNVEKCEKIIAREIEDLAGNTLSERAFAKAREQYCGQLLVRSDSRKNSIAGAATSLLRYGEILSTEWRAEQIRNVTSGQLREMAELIAGSEMSRLSVS